MPARGRQRQLQGDLILERENDGGEAAAVHRDRANASGDDEIGFTRIVDQTNAAAAQEFSAQGVRDHDFHAGISRIVLERLNGDGFDFTEATAVANHLVSTAGESQSNRDQ